MRLALALVMVACSGNSKPAPEPTKPGSAAASTWPIPQGWRSEVIPFPLDFAPAIAHTGVEELRFPAGFLKPESSEYWSYAFIWRTTDAAQLDANALAAELTLYFKGLIKAVDEKKQQVKDHDAIVATASPVGSRFVLSAHVFDAFTTGQAVDLSGWAERRACGTGALWVFVLAPENTSIRAQLDELAKGATCN